MCDTFVVVHPDGVLFGKNSDRDPNEPQVLEQVPRRTYAKGAELACTWRVIPQVRETHAVLLSRPAWMWGAEMGVNEHGLRVGNEAVFTRRRVSHEGLTGMDLVRLTLERAATVDEAIAVLQQLLVTEGQGGRCGFDNPDFRYHSSFLIADAHEAAVVETTERALVVERVRAGARAISNGLSVPGFAARFSDPVRTWVASAALRRARVTCLAAKARTLADAIAVLRDHGDAGPAPVWSPFTGAMTGPCVHAGGWVAAAQTTASLVSWVGPAAQHHLATGTSAPCLSAFKPVSVHAPIGVDPLALWHDFDALHRYALRSTSALPAAWYEARASLEAEALRDPTQAPGPLWDAFSRMVAQEVERQRVTPVADERPWWLRTWWARQQGRFSTGG